METSQTIGKLAEALAKAQPKFKAVKRDANNPFFKSKYAPLENIIEATTPSLSENGLSVIQAVVPSDGHIAVETQLMHLSGEWIRGRIELTPVKTDPQGMGSAITYARRYALGAMLGVASEEDDDGNEASGTDGKVEGKTGGDSDKSSPPKREHWCEKHKTAFFKTANMKAYAHPIQGTKSWCNEQAISDEDFANMMAYCDQQSVTEAELLHHLGIGKLKDFTGTSKALMDAIDQCADKRGQSG